MKIRPHSPPALNPQSIPGHSLPRAGPSKQPAPRPSAPCWARPSPRCTASIQPSTPGLQAPRANSCCFLKTLHRHPLLQDTLACIHDGPSDFSEPPQPGATNSQHFSGSSRGLAGPGFRSSPSSGQTGRKWRSRERSTAGGRAACSNLPGCLDLQQHNLADPQPCPWAVQRMGFPVPEVRAPSPLPQCQVRRSGHRETGRSRASPSLCQL